MPSTDPTATRKTYFGIQALRAIAAGLVVVHHAAVYWLEHTRSHPRAEELWRGGAGGVDIFFVISGFVMAVSAPSLAGKANKAWVFLKRRVIRVVPLYWIFTTLSLARMIVGMLRGQPPGEQASGSTWHILASYLFIPSYDDQHALFPVVGIGWTLNFEMLFYFLFAVALALDVSLLAFLLPVLVALAAIGGFDHPTWPAFTTLASPLVLEFLFGVLIAHWTQQGRRPGKFVCAALFVGGCAAIAAIPLLDARWRWLTWGVPAAAIVTATVGTEDAVGERLPGWLLEAGNASYALYLVHRSMLSVAWVGVVRLGPGGHAALVEMIAGSLLVSLVAAEVLHRGIELPLMKFFNRKRVPGVNVLPAGSGQTLAASGPAR